MTAKKYALTEEHKAQLPAWRDKWIANAMSTRPMDDAERERIRGAIRGLYEAAGLVPPPDHRIVFVPSPFVARFAGGFASWIWHRRKGQVEHPTYAATIDATRDATEAATIDATYAATAATTEAATRDATDAATYAATDAATGAATIDATGAATIDATNAATDAATDKWYSVDTSALARLATRFGGPSALRCAQRVWGRMWNGGNQWSGWPAYLSFFRHVARLDLDYSKWRHYEIAAEAGPRVMHAEFCLVSERPTVLRVDAQNRPHCETGPFCAWRDGSALYSWHGVRVPRWMIEHPERITVATIDAETNVEVRRVMIQRLGADRYLIEAGATLVQSDRYGELYRREVPGDDPILMVKVMNSTPEVDGTRKPYWLRVHPECRPLPVPANKMQLGEPQALTAHNAVASTFGRRGEEYAPEVET